VSSKQLLSEMFGIVGLPALREDEEDDAFDRAGWGKGKSDPNAHTNSQLGTAKSVAGPGAPTKRPSAFADVQGSLDGSKSVFDEAAGSTGITMDGDKETLSALMECLQEAEGASGLDSGVAKWAGGAWKAIAAGIRGNGSVTLPKFQEKPTPAPYAEEDPDMMDDGGGEAEEEDI
jgi:hypothetical protein